MLKLADYLEPNMDKILSFLSPVKYYLLLVALLAYPCVFFWGDLHGRNMQIQKDAAVTVQLDKQIASDNKKAADAALSSESKLSTDIANLENQKNAPLPASDDPCHPSPERVQSLQDLIDKANKP